ncbi:hypothetical protein D4757_06640, partial [Enterocloster bolteae]|uniref:hypothetical protein n=1 Tax=Enterocloster bolteae TaxID=208479 RepID=UPI001D141877
IDKETYHKGYLQTFKRIRIHYSLFSKRKALRNGINTTFLRVFNILNCQTWDYKHCAAVCQEGFLE